MCLDFCTSRGVSISTDRMVWDGIRKEGGIGLESYSGRSGDRPRHESRERHVACKTMSSVLWV
ncbi:hypothetical protein P153DRAFT_79420 [Dothidotthia symphoricarpi CBS 119687]|uniref:Uncharacterized protein n=1 Tax=Dothidotthia symphoricarpi CBS 119687 TaxID=1392245 RepID=A0A6A6A5U8_9PLEO|nr:uncharacterized protein P153DRAFT_79420 [Dothidotthia symphoricarpi CBS 119687]KAF2126533.1 hypothetical protein P153DRAFT_79420 [Dothidotthia symphoricarpi CBS 119687]